MTMSKVITIKQGDADTLTEVITGLSSLSGYTAKLYIKDTDGDEIDTITGSISVLTITYLIVNNDSKSYPVGTHNFETKVFDSSDHVYTPTSGKFVVEPSLEEDPS